VLNSKRKCFITCPMGVFLILTVRPIKKTAKTNEGNYYKNRTSFRTTEQKGAEYIRSTWILTEGDGQADPKKLSKASLLSQSTDGKFNNDCYSFGAGKNISNQNISTLSTMPLLASEKNRWMRHLYTISLWHFWSAIRVYAVLLEPLWKFVTESKSWK